ncbi:hypothetical protein VTJ04DRAFT_3701 [Mycothermus thermophilus]|uniref:uncharacterized protein n=1 Tax=Humicola insolens TaxID=85995 RepID=UPI003743E70F
MFLLSFSLTPSFRWFGDVCGVRVWYAYKKTWEVVPIYEGARRWWWVLGRGKFQVPSGEKKGALEEGHDG